MELTDHDIMVDVGAGRMCRHHGVHGVQIVLEIRVDGDDGVARHGEQSREQRILVAAIARQLEPTQAGVFLSESFDDHPRGIGGPVVDEVHLRRSGDEPRQVHRAETLPEPARRLGEHVLLVVTRHDHRESYHDQCATSRGAAMSALLRTCTTATESV